MMNDNNNIVDIMFDHNINNNNDNDKNMKICRKNADFLSVADALPS